MNRRTMLTSALSAPLALAGVSRVEFSCPVRLEAGAIRIDMSVHDDGGGPWFSLTLLEKPWPAVGDRIAFDHQGLHLTGTVTGFVTESVQGRDRVFYHVIGTVQEFEALPVYGNV